MVIRLNVDINHRWKMELIEFLIIVFTIASFTFLRRNEAGGALERPGRK